HRRGARRVTLQSPAAGSGASQGDVVAVATTPGLGRGATLEPLSWQAMRFARGRLTLGGLRSDPVGAPAGCASADHAVVGGGGRQRTVRLWAVVSPDVRCLWASEAVLAPGHGWSRRTIAWSAPLDRARPTLPRQRTIRIERGVLQPDRRHAVVSYWHGACDALASTSATLDGRRVRVTVRLGDTVPPETACAAIAVQGQALVTLPARAPRDAIFVAADGR
ncbi:hypothetical protein, partial [Patulibacter medicamentivorans]|uniref:hypothetical protein n=1 Tax=Patulibacter medicamentivorans TaxID=1097667 RepID=UPI00058B263B